VTVKVKSVARDTVILERGEKTWELSLHSPQSAKGEEHGIIPEVERIIPREQAAAQSEKKSASAIEYGSILIYIAGANGVDSKGNIFLGEGYQATIIIDGRCYISTLGFKTTPTGFLNPGWMAFKIRAPAGTHDIRITSTLHGTHESQTWNDFSVRPGKVTKLAFLIGMSPGSGDATEITDLMERTDLTGLYGMKEYEEKNVPPYEIDFQRKIGINQSR